MWFHMESSWPDISRNLENETRAELLKRETVRMKHTNEVYLRKIL